MTSYASVGWRLYPGISSKHELIVYPLKLRYPLKIDGCEDDSFPLKKKKGPFSRGTIRSFSGGKPCWKTPLEALPRSNWVGNFLIAQMTPVPWGNSGWRKTHGFCLRCFEKNTWFPVVGVYIPITRIPFKRWDNSYMCFYMTRWWFPILFIFTRKIGEMIRFDQHQHIFQVGWNHQLVLLITNQNVIVLKQKFWDEMKRMIFCFVRCFFLVPKKLWYFWNMFFPHSLAKKETHFGRIVFGSWLKWFPQPLVSMMDTQDCHTLQDTSPSSNFYAYCCPISRANLHEYDTPSCKWSNFLLWKPGC